MNDKPTGLQLPPRGSVIELAIEMEGLPFIHCYAEGLRCEGEWITPIAPFTRNMFMAVGGATGAFRLPAPPVRLPRHVTVLRTVAWEPWMSVTQDDLSKARQLLIAAGIDVPKDGFTRVCDA